VRKDKTGGGETGGCGCAMLGKDALEDSPDLLPLRDRSQPALSGGSGRTMRKPQYAQGVGGRGWASITVLHRRGTSSM